MASSARKEEDISSSSKRMASEDGLYVLDLSERGSKARERDYSDLDIILDLGHADAQRSADPAKTSPFSICQPESLVRKRLDSGLGRTPRGFQMPILTIKESLKSKTQDILPSLCLKCKTKEKPGPIGHGSLFNLKAKTELKVLSKEIHSIFLRNPEMSATNSKLFDQLSVKILTEDTPVSDVRISNLGLLFSKKG